LAITIFWWGWEMSTKGSRTAVTAEVSLGLVGPENGIVPLMASLTYSCADPYAVTMAFHVGTAEPVEWTLARDLLAAALHRREGNGREGIGDVQAWPSGESADPAAVEGACAGQQILNISMTSPFGHARFEARARDIERFLARTFEIVPQGDEPSFMNFDDELTDLLSQELAGHKSPRA
jgi:Streptomyces sporulation and cell division protein, SsgA